MMMDEEEDEDEDEDKMRIKMRIKMAKDRCGQEPHSMFNSEQGVKAGSSHAQ